MKTYESRSIYDKKYIEWIGQVRSKYTRKNIYKTTKIEDDQTVPDFDQKTVKDIFNQIIFTEFPQHIFDTFKNEYILDDTFAKQIFVEYAKFLVMIKLSDYNL